MDKIESDKKDEKLAELLDQFLKDYKSYPDQATISLGKMFGNFFAFNNFDGEEFLINFSKMFIYHYKYYLEKENKWEAE